MSSAKDLTTSERGEITTVIGEGAVCLSVEEQDALSQKIVGISEGVAGRVYQHGRYTGMQDAYEVAFHNKSDAGFDTEISDVMESEVEANGISG